MAPICKPEEVKEILVDLNSATLQSVQDLIARHCLSVPFVDQGLTSYILFPKFKSNHVTFPTSLSEILGVFAGVFSHVFSFKKHDYLLAFNVDDDVFHSYTCTFTDLVCFSVGKSLLECGPLFPANSDVSTLLIPIIDCIANLNPKLPRGEGQPILIGFLTAKLIALLCSQCSHAPDFLTIASTICKVFKKSFQKFSNVIKFLPKTVETEDDLVSIFGRFLPFFKSSKNLKILTVGDVTYSISDLPFEDSVDFGKHLFNSTSSLRNLTNNNSMTPIFFSLNLLPLLHSFLLYFPYSPFTPSIELIGDSNSGRRTILEILKYLTDNQIAITSGFCIKNNRNSVRTVIVTDIFGKNSITPYCSSYLTQYLPLLVADNVSHALIFGYQLFYEQSFLIGIFSKFLSILCFWLTDYLQKRKHFSNFLTSSLNRKSYLFKF
ncbi:hypothetical protein GEMRC1_012297 [Eukaryota sp. GEM-RC1]